MEFSIFKHHGGRKDTTTNIVLYLSKHVSMSLFTKNLIPEDSPTIDIPELVQLLVIMVKLKQC